MNNVVMTTAATVNRVAGRIDVAGNVEHVDGLHARATAATTSAAPPTHRRHRVLDRGRRRRDGRRRLVQHARRGGHRDARRLDAEQRPLAGDLRQPALRLVEHAIRSATSSRSASARRRRHGPDRDRGWPACRRSGGEPVRVRAVRSRHGGVGPRHRCTSPTDAAGLQKWTFNGTTWTLATTLNIAGNAGFRGVAGYAAGGTVTLMASTAENPPNRLVVFVDDGVNTPTGSRGRHRARRTPRSAASPSRRTSPRRNERQRSAIATPPSARRRRGAAAAASRRRLRRRPASPPPSPASALPPSSGDGLHTSGGPDPSAGLLVAQVLADGRDARLHRADLVVARDRLDRPALVGGHAPAPSRRCSCCPRGRGVPSRSASARSRGIGVSVQSSKVTPPSPERHATPAVVPPSPGSRPATSTVPLARRANALSEPPAQRDRRREASCRRRG